MTGVQPQNQKLLRILGIGFGIAVNVGGTVGVGILRTPGLVAEQLGNTWLIVAAWILGGGYAFLGTISVSELGAMVTEAGGWYAYARRAFGDYVGFTVGWCDWIAQSAALAYLSTAVGEFAVALFPAWSGYVRLVAILLLVLFALLHWMGLRISNRAQEITSLAKAIGLAAFVIACFLYGKGADSAWHRTSLNLHFTPLSFFAAAIIALQSIINTYDGWYSANYFTEEDVNPAQNLPRSAIGGVLVTILIYMLVNAGLLHALSLPQMAASKMPATDVAQAIFGVRGGQVITALSLISLLSVINAVLLLATRILFAISRHGLFFSRVASVSPNGTPVPAMILTTLSAIVLISTGTFETLLGIAAFLYVVVYVSGFASLFMLRKKEPDLHRPFHVWGYPWTTLVAMIVSIVFLCGSIYGDIRDSLFALVLIALSYPSFRIAARLRAR